MIDDRAHLERVLASIAQPHQPDYDSISSCVCGETYPCTTLWLVDEVRRLRGTREATMALIREGREVHDCTDGIPSPSYHDLGAVAACDECGRRWKLAKVGWTWKEWRRTAPTFVRDLAFGRRAVVRWAAVGRHVKLPRSEMT